MNPALDYARGRRALRPLLRSLTFVAELIAKPFRKAADFCDSPGPCNPRLGSVLQIAGVSQQSRSPGWLCTEQLKRQFPLATVSPLAWRGHILAIEEA
jgi:hypothetical protein